MLCRKNLYSGKSNFRFVMGLAVAALSYFPAPSATIARLAIAMGVMLAMTGVFGWRPMCAMAGRKIDDPN